MSQIILTSDIVRSPRVMQIEGLFDIEATKKSTTVIENKLNHVNEKDWNVGLIVGPSGAGKSTVARNTFGDKVFDIEKINWSKNHSLLDDFPETFSTKQIVELLSAVGFSSPPSWLRSFDDLSNGEKFRVGIARLMAESPQLIVVDEFTSFVDRTVAQISSHAIAKTIRKNNSRLVAVTCHYDVQDWLQPDWIFQPHASLFTWGSVQPRPKVEVECIRSNTKAWSVFSKHHYLDHSLNKAADVYVGLIEGQPAVLLALLHLVHSRIKRAKRVSRLVTLPDFQGLGLGLSFLEMIAQGLKSHDYATYITTSHPTMVRTLNKKISWEMRRKPSRVGRVAKTTNLAPSSRSRITSNFRFIGQANADYGRLLFS